MSFENKVGKTPNEQISRKELEKKLRAEGISYEEFSIVKECLEDHNHHLTFSSLLEFTKKIKKEFRHGLEEEGLDTILTAYTLEEIDSLLARLPDDILLLDVAAAYSEFEDLVEKEDLEAIFTINQFDKYDFRKALEYLPQALESFPLDDVKKMFSEGISYEELSIVKECLKDHNHHLTFSSLLEFTKKIIKEFRYSLEEEGLDTILTAYTPEEIDSLLARLPDDISLLDVVDTYSEFKDVVEKDDLEAIFLISKNKIDLTIVQSCLKEHNHPYTLTSLLEFTKKIREEFRYSLEEEGLDTILTAYTPEEIDSLLARLPDDISLLDVAAAYSEFKDVVKKDDLETILFIIQFGEDDFRGALKSLPLDDAKKMFSEGVSYYEEFSIVKRCLEKHKHSYTFTPLLEFTKKMKKFLWRHGLNEDSLNTVLTEYTPEEIDSLIPRLPDGIFLEELSIVKRVLKKHKHSYTFTSLLEFTKKIKKEFRYSLEEEGLDTILTAYTLEEIDSLLARLPDDISLLDVVDTYNELKDVVEKDDFETIFLTLQNEVLKDTIKAGYTPKEIQRFPFLVSPLVTEDKI